MPDSTTIPSDATSALPTIGTRWKVPDTSMIGIEGQLGGISGVQGYEWTLADGSKIFLSTGTVQADLSWFQHPVGSGRKLCYNVYVTYNAESIAGLRSYLPETFPANPLQTGVPSGSVDHTNDPTSGPKTSLADLLGLGQAASAASKTALSVGVLIVIGVLAYAFIVGRKVI